jgi:hypothetical protein
LRSISPRRVLTPVMYSIGLVNMFGTEAMDKFNIEYLRFNISFNSNPIFYFAESFESKKI